MGMIGMKRVISFIIITSMILIFIFGAMGVMADPTTVTWSEDITIDGRYTVSENEHLIIEPGVRVLFQENASLYVKGTLTAQGTFDDPIIFTSSSESPIPGIWDKISFKSQASKDCILSYSHIEYAEQGIQLSSSGIKIENNLIENISKYGIKVVGGSSPEISHNTIRTDNIGIRISKSSKPLVYKNILDDNTFYGIYCDDNSKPQIEENTISGTEWGIYSHLAKPEIKNNLIEDCTYGILHYLSKGTIKDNTITNSKINGIKCKYADPRILGNSIAGSGKDGIYAFYSSPKIQGNTIQNNSLWGISSVGQSHGVEYKEFFGSSSNGIGWARQGWLLNVIPVDENNESIYDVEITLKNGKGEVLFTSNSGNRHSFLLNITQKYYRNDGTLVDSSKYYIVLNKEGYQSNETDLVIKENRNLYVHLEEEEETVREYMAPGFGAELLIIGFAFVIFVLRRGGSNLI
jgi:parallel beta-helix repeat protein